MVVLGEEAPKLLKCIPIDSISFGSYSLYQNFLISSTSSQVSLLSGRFVLGLVCLRAREIGGGEAHL